MNPLEHINMLKCLLADINSILKKHSISQISIEHITVTDNSVIGIDKPDKPLSSLIIPISIEHIIVTIFNLFLGR